MAISGIAVLDTHYVVIHDNKKPNQPRIATVKIRGKKLVYKPIPWCEGEAPLDIESIVQFPERSREYFAAASNGMVYHIRLADNASGCQLLEKISIPDWTSPLNLEGLAIYKLNGINWLIWSDRGGDDRSGSVYWAKLIKNEKQEYALGGVFQAKVTVPYPIASDKRHISDLYVDKRNGALMVSSASDPGDDGPFDSALYFIGRFKPEPNGEDIVLQQDQPPLLLHHFNGHKVEGFTFDAKGSLIVTTDDENGGGYFKKIE